MKRVIRFLLKGVKVYLGFILFTQAQASPVADAIEPVLSMFFSTQRAQATLLQMKANSLQAQGVMSDSPLTVSLNLEHKKGGQLSDGDLAISPFENAFQTDALQTSLALTPRNIGILNSLEFDLTHSLGLNQYQVYPGLGLNPPNNTQTWEIKLSYDVVKGGGGEPQQLGNQIAKYNFNSNFYSYAKHLVADYLVFRDLLLDLMSSWCKLQNASADLQVINTTLNEIQVAYQVKAISYKQVLNVMDTRNSILRNQLNYQLQFENNHFSLKAWDEKKADEIMKSVVAHSVCKFEKSSISKLFDDYQTQDHTGFVFDRSIDFMIDLNSLSATEAQVAYDRNTQIPSVRPFLGLTQSNQLGYQYLQFEAGVALSWNVPGEKQNTTVAGDRLQFQSGKSNMDFARQQFVSSDLLIANDLERNKDILKASWESYANSNSLIKLLEVQKSIGQVDSLSISNAYTQRNQILNSLYDSLVTIEKDYAHWRALIDWKTVLNKAGYKLK